MSVARPILIIPAAGMGSRLKASQPKALVPVAGVPMVRRLLDLYAPWVSAAVVVVSPGAETAMRAVLGPAVKVALQHHPTGMLDAVLAAAPVLPHRSPVWVTWCDQLLVRTATIDRLSQLTAEPAGAALVMPTVRRAAPYIHLERDATGRIVEVRQQREGDAMPAEGESDMGLFGLSEEGYWTLLPEFAATAAAPSTSTKERNFLPFIPWVAGRRGVRTFPCTDPAEAAGVNTPEELAAAERYLQEHG